MAFGRRILAGAVGLLIASGALADDARLRLITVGGEADVSAPPDRADVPLAVEASEKSLADAQRRATEGVERVLALCDQLGIARAQVRSAQAVVQPQYESGALSSRPRIVGYVASREMVVDLRDLSKLGALLEGAIDAGANRVTPPTFGSSRRDDLQRGALAKAAEDARANAQAIAKTLGVKLGPLHTLTANESGGEPVPMVYAMRAKAADSSAAESYSPGEIKFHASVTASFDLSP